MFIEVDSDFSWPSLSCLLSFLLQVKKKKKKKCDSSFDQHSDPHSDVDVLSAVASVLEKQQFEIELAKFLEEALWMW